MLRLKDKIEASVTYADRAGSATMADVANAVAWDNVGGKPSTFPPSDHSHSYLPLSGGTLSGDIAFASIYDTGKSAGLQMDQLLPFPVELW